MSLSMARKASQKKWRLRWLVWRMGQVSMLSLQLLLRMHLHYSQSCHLESFRAYHFNTTSTKLGGFSMSKIKLQRLKAILLHQGCWLNRHYLINKFPWPEQIQCMYQANTEKIKTDLVALTCNPSCLGGTWPRFKAKPRQKVGEIPISTKKLSVVVKTYYPSYMEDKSKRISPQGLPGQEGEKKHKTLSEK
jgi:hypothetical protein